MPYTQGPATGREAPVGLNEFSQILRRRWKTIAVTTALVTSLGAAFAMALKPQFTATTLIFVDPRARASFQIEGTGIGGGYDPNLVDSQIVLDGYDAASPAADEGGFADAQIDSTASRISLMGTDQNTPDGPQRSVASA